MLPLLSMNYFLQMLVAFQVEPPLRLSTCGARHWHVYTSVDAQKDLLFQMIHPPLMGAAGAGLGSFRQSLVFAPAFSVPLGGFKMKA